MFLFRISPNMAQIDPHNMQNRELYHYKIVIFTLNYKNSPRKMLRGWCMGGATLLTPKRLTPPSGVSLLHKNGKVTNWQRQHYPFCILPGRMRILLGDNRDKNIVICGFHGWRDGLIPNQKNAPFTPLFTHKFRGKWCRNGG